jgi:hypothetical protein
MPAKRSRRWSSRTAFLEAQIEKLTASVSTGYAREPLDLPKDRKDWYD